MKLMVIGYAQHGKDTVCSLLKQMYGYTFESSSYFCAERAVKPWLEARGITYNSIEEMYADRGNHRAAWHDAIAAYNTPDPARLGKELYSKYDIYCGIRSEIEFLELQAQGIFDVAFWVSASDRVPPEPESSNKLHEYHADYTIHNNGSQELLKLAVREAHDWAVQFVLNKRK